MSDRYWYCLITAPNTEFETASKLHRLNVDTLVPVLRKDVRVARHKTVTRDFALWPRYVFAGFNSSRPWFALEHIETITGALGFDGQPMLIPTSTVDVVREAAAKPIEMRRNDLKRNVFRIGDKVRLLRGPFMHHIAEVSAVRKKSAEIFLELFGSIQGVSIPLDAIEQAAA